MFETRVLSLERVEKIRDILRKLGCEEEGVEIMSPKAQHFIVCARNIDSRAANILKQEFLSSDGETAVPWAALDISEGKSDVIMMGTRAQYQRVFDKLEEQPFDLPVLADEIKRALQYHEEPKRLPWGHDRTQVMGVLNVTPDSFYDGGKYDRKKKAVQRALEMERKGADIIDIGGESTRPGSERVSLREEKERVIPVIEELSGEVDCLLSIDTYKPEVAEAAVEAGTDMVNDVFGLRKEGMPEKVAELDVPVIIMHMQGSPKSMQDDIEYEDVMNDISSFFLERTDKAKEAGIDPDDIILDPGIGFGKRLEHNLEIIERLDEFNSLGYPVLLGASRKSFLQPILEKEASERLYGSLAVAATAVERNVSILRVHDVEETLDVIKTVEALNEV